MAKIKITEYDYPEDIETEYLTLVKPIIIIDESEFELACRHGCSWEQMSHYYMISVPDLKRHFLPLYTKSRASMSIGILNAMVSVGMSGNFQMLKWLSQNWLGMVEKTVTQLNITDPKLLDLAEIDQKLTKLLSKGKK